MRSRFMDFNKLKKKYGERLTNTTLTK